MRKDSLIFMAAGFAAGFAILYYWTRHREPQIVNATPARLELPATSGPSPSQGTPVPAVDMAQVQELQNKIKANPGDYDALVALANINFDQRNFSEAADLYIKALAVKDNPDVRTDLGTMLFYSDRYDEALTELNRVLAVKPTHAQALFNLGVVQLHGKNDSKGALQTWEKLIQTNPDFPQRAVVEEQIKALKDSLKK